jgi:hypothetical protein
MVSFFNSHPPFVVPAASALVRPAFQFLTKQGVGSTVSRGHAGDPMPTQPSVETPLRAPLGAVLLARPNPSRSSRVPARLSSAGRSGAKLELQSLSDPCVRLAPSARSLRTVGAIPSEDVGARPARAAPSGTRTCTPANAPSRAVLAG